MNTEQIVKTVRTHKSQKGCQLNPERQTPTLFMRLVTWQRDSHGLFDYESSNTDKL